MVDTCVSGAYEEIRGGSSPPFGIKKQIEIYSLVCFLNIGFQDSCDGSFIVDLPNFRAIEASL